ncbi:PWWP domain, partial [Cinara cedri]
MATKEPTPFTPGTLVWAKFYDIFWPGKVVDPSSAPQKTQDIMNQKRNPLAMVFFVEDNKYDIVMSINKVFLYSCPKKMEYVKKGYSLYLRELNGIKTKNVEMKNFLKDVLRFEEEIGGNINIFKEFEKERDEEKTPKRQQLIKKLFSSSSGHKKEKSKKKKIKQQLNISILSPTTSNTTQRNMTEEPNIQDELLKDEDNKKDKNDEDNEKDKNDDDHMNEDNKKDKND